MGKPPMRQIIKNISKSTFWYSMDMIRRAILVTIALFVILGTPSQALSLIHIFSSFSAYERRIIHEHIAENYQSLESFSEGEGEDRYLVIAQKKS